MVDKFLPRGYRNAELLNKSLQTRPEKVWIRSGAHRALRQFHEMSQRVPAYKDFLKKNKFKATSVQTLRDFKKIPIVDKDNYLRVYPRSDLVWDGKFSDESWVISTTSGSTGKPYYFPRTNLQDAFLTITTELYLRSNFSIQEKSTLYIDAFPMGAWIGGVFTYESIKQIGEKGYRISIITPGIHKQEVINAVLQLGHDFDQIIIGAYAPFLKDILDDGVRQGLEWPKYNLGFIFSAEAFTELFRDYVLKTCGSQDTLKTTLNHYGTVDLGTMAHETPVSIMIRRRLVEDDKLSLLFPESRRQPTFAQFNPELFYFESVENTLLCSSFSGMPLVRYDLKDYGGVIKQRTVIDKLEQDGYSFTEQIEENHITDTVWNLPFVYVYERNDFSVSYYSFLIYPDMIRRALQVPTFESQLTGKFTMSVDYSKSGRQQFHIQIELKHGVKNSRELLDKITNIIHTRLLDESSEYRESCSVVGEIIKPIVKLWPYESDTYFKSGTKQKWVAK